MGLKTRVKTLFNDALRMCDSCGESELLANEIRNLLVRLDEPLRVAVVGIMKAGKSTLLNAMMKEKILFTGNVETTYTVSWFKYGPKPMLKIIFKDGDSTLEPYESLAKWTVRDSGIDNPRLDDVQYVEIQYPNEILKTMELIDTPGLLSTYKMDSANTMDFLGMKQAEDATIMEASTADAIIYAFSKGLQANDADILKAFQGEMVTPNTSPINALGVFTKSDVLWDMMDDPMEIAKQVTNNLMSKQQIKSLLYTISPVSAKMVECILDMSEKEWDIIQRLSKLEEQLLLNVLFDQTCFMEYSAGEFEEALEITFDEETKSNLCLASERKQVCALCGQYGIYLMTQAVKQGLEKEQIIDYMYEKSGIKGINDTIREHFGNRAFVIKLKYVFARVLGMCSSIMRRGNNNQLMDICEYLKDEIDLIQDTEQAFKELKVLQNYYNGMLKFHDENELQCLLHVTGEYGKSCEARLNVPEGTSVTSLAIAARNQIDYWNARANDIPITRYFEEAAQVLSRSCDIMYYHLQALTGDDT